MRSAVGILTYRRSDTLKTMLSGLMQHCGHYPTLISEDCGQRDDTADYLKAGREPKHRPDVLAYEYVPVENPKETVNCSNYRVLMGACNVGVAGNSNKILKWFMEETDADHLCFCNDDLNVHGDFVKFYAGGHADLDVGLYCFCDFDRASPAISGPPETYKWTTYQVRGYGVKFLPRFTGIMLSITRKLVEQVGYFDSDFKKFGEEHSDYTIRCRFAGGIRLEGQDMNCLDLEHSLLSHQDCGTSLSGPERDQANAEAAEIMEKAASEYFWRHYYRPFGMLTPKFAGGYKGGGILVSNLLGLGYKLVTDLAL